MKQLLKIVNYTFLLILLFNSGNLNAQLLFFDSNDLASLRKQLSKDQIENQNEIYKLKKIADKLLKEKPLTITSIHVNGMDISPNDYFSEGPYWWPDPDNPQAAYIKRDGVRNPERFTGHKELLIKMYGAVSALAYAAYFFDDKKYADKAVEFIDTWFVNEETKMNPNLKYSQLIRNRDVKRGVGIIDTHRFTKLVEALNILRSTGYWNDDSYDNTKKWFSEFLHWLLESKYGIDEKERGNNHSSWWAAQVAAYAAFTGEINIQTDLRNYVKYKLIENQITAEGRQPLEEVRTLSLSYSAFNLNALCTVASILDRDSATIFNYRNQNGASINDAINFLNPYISKTNSWDKEQIKPLEDDSPIYLGLSGLRQHKESDLSLYARLMRDKGENGFLSYDDPFEYLLDSVIKMKLKVNQ